MVNRFENFVISILRLNKLIQKIKVFEMEDYSLRAVHVMCIYYLDENSDGLTASELSRMTLEDKAAISRALATLRERGYIKYNSKKYNSKVQLTDEGAQIARYIEKRASSYVDMAGGELSEGDRESMYSSLSLITKRLDEYYNTLSAQCGDENEE